MGAATEARYAARNTDTMTALRVDIKTPGSGRPGDIDALETLSDGRKLGSEIKNSAASVSQNDIGDIRAGYQELIANGVVDEYQIVFRQLNDDTLVDWMNNEEIPYTILNRR